MVLKLLHFTKNYRTYEKNEKGPRKLAYTVVKLCPGNCINVTVRRLCPLNKTATVCFTQHSQLHRITPSLLLLLPFNTKAPYLHMVSVFYHRELNSLKETQNYRAFGLFWHYDRILYRGQNYHTKMWRHW